MPQNVDFKLAVFLNSNIQPSVKDENGVSHPIGPPAASSGAPFVATSIYKACFFQWLFTPTSVPAAWEFWGSPSLILNSNEIHPGNLYVDVWDLNPNFDSAATNIALSQFGLMLNDSSPFASLYWAPGKPVTPVPSAPNFPVGLPKKVLLASNDPALTTNSQLVTAPQTGRVSTGASSVQSCAVWPSALTLVFNEVSEPC